MARRRALRLALPVVVIVYAAAATSPAIAQSLPRYTLPAFAAIGAAGATWSLWTAVTRLRRGTEGSAARRVVLIVVNLVAVVFLVILPGIRLIRLLIGPSPGAPLVFARFGDRLGTEGYPLLHGRHWGIDVLGRKGTDVLAAAAGRVAVARDTRDLCGLTVMVLHDPYGYRTIYCHFAEITVRVGDEVPRGGRLGTLGTSGLRAWPGYEHVHLELQKGPHKRDVEDPLPATVGCFEPGIAYPTDRLVLTYPVRC